MVSFDSIKFSVVLYEGDKLFEDVAGGGSLKPIVKVPSTI